jgi:hypothetical protein
MQLFFRLWIWNVLWNTDRLLALCECFILPRKDRYNSSLGLLHLNTPYWQRNGFMACGTLAVDDWRIEAFIHYASGWLRSTFCTVHSVVSLSGTASLPLTLIDVDILLLSFRLPISCLHTCRLTFNAEARPDNTVFKNSVRTSKRTPHFTITKMI